MSLIGILLIIIMLLGFIIFGLIQSIKSYIAKNKQLEEELENKRNTISSLYSFIDKNNKINEWRKQVENKEDIKSALSDVISNNNSKLQNNKQK